MGPTSACVFLFVSFCVDVDVVAKGVFRFFLVEVTFGLGVETIPAPLGRARKLGGHRSGPDGLGKDDTADPVPLRGRVLQGGKEDRVHPAPPRRRNVGGQAGLRGVWFDDLPDGRLVA